MRKGKHNSHFLRLHTADCRSVMKNILKRPICGNTGAASRTWEYSFHQFEEHLDPQWGDKNRTDGQQNSDVS